MKKLLSVLLSAVLLVTLVSSIGAVAEERTVITMGGKQSNDHFLEFDAYKKMQDDLNITIEYTYYNADSYSAMLAGGDMPDLVLGRENLDIVLGNHLALDLSPYLDQLPNLTNGLYADTLALTRSLWGGENQGVYVLCPVIGQHCWNGGNYMTERGYSVCWDYYKEIGCPPINNDDEYIEVLLKMHENHPTADDGTPSYLFGVRSNFDDMGGFRASFRSDIAVNPWSGSLYAGSTYDNHLVNGFTDVEHSAYWADMEFYNKLYKTGLWDMDCFTMSNDEYEAKLNNHQYMGVYEAWRSQEPYKVVPSTGMTVYTNVLLPTGNAPGNFTFVSANTEHLDECLAYINYIYSEEFNRLVYSGVQGVDWDYDENGVPALTQKSIEDRAAGTEYWSSTGNGYGYRWWYTNAYNPAVTASDGYPLDLSYTPEALKASQTAPMKDFCDAFGVDFWYDAFTGIGMTDFSHDISEPIGGAISGDVPMDIKRIVETCNDILYTAMPGLIMAESEEEFAALRDEALEELAASGENEAWEWYSAAWAEKLPIFTGYLEEQLKALGIED